MSDSRIRRRSDERRTEQETESSEDLQCPECGGNLAVDEERGETVCTECGLVVEEDEIDRGPEWRAFDSAEKDKKSRGGAPPTNKKHPQR
ncbi:TFIIB-type zinc ribbon-containing protein, partial [Salarchaeum sp. III]|uniref:TFIIB-type zinc ribbon-containing protein n=1 Tax=Salarchaeum sp. III TaxID=3107927 RepID=UPI002EDA216A